jgi:succinate dehydrogenase/fumarate reductase cytochrome b subunit
MALGTVHAGAALKISTVSSVYVKMETLIVKVGVVHTVVGVVHTVVDVGCSLCDHSKYGSALSSFLRDCHLTTLWSCCKTVHATYSACKILSWS